MHTVSHGARGLVADLFSGHRRRRLFIHHAIENRAGSAIVDSEQRPTVAALKVGQVTLLGGDPTSGAVEQIVRALSHTITTPEDQRWHDLICGIHGDKINKRRRTEFTSEGLDSAQLERFAKSHTEGVLVKLDAELSRRLAVT